MTDFSAKLHSLVSLEMSRGGRSDPATMSGMIENLAGSLAFTVAIACQGDDKAISTMLDGMTEYIYSTAAERAPLAKMIAESTRRGV